MRVPYQITTNFEMASLQTKIYYECNGKSLIYLGMFSKYGYMKKFTIF